MEAIMIALLVSLSWLSTFSSIPQYHGVMPRKGTQLVGVLTLLGPAANVGVDATKNGMLVTEKRIARETSSFLKHVNMILF